MCTRCHTDQCGACPSGHVLGGLYPGNDLNGPAPQQPPPRLLPPPPSNGLTLFARARLAEGRVLRDEKCGGGGGRGGVVEVSGTTLVVDR